ncbi:MAG TPA: hypothetical protein VJ476_05955 [Rhizomicrobium sp.]|nr:hypothetical protein [Rhizomicrobium sp.]
MSQQTWFVADEHYGHKNIIQFCNRPFTTTDQMQDGLIKLHNEVVAPRDHVYHIGDMFWRTLPLYRATAIMDKLNGIHYYILGNHEEMFEKEDNGYFFKSRFMWIKERTRIKPAGGPKAGIVLDHFAGRVWDQSDKGSWQLYGHTHGDLPEDPSLLSMDVGIDSSPFLRPFSLAEVRVLMEAKMEKMRRRIEVSQTS